MGVLSPSVLQHGLKDKTLRQQLGGRHVKHFLVVIHVGHGEGIEEVRVDFVGILLKTFVFDMEVFGAFGEHLEGFAGEGFAYNPCGAIGRPQVADGEPKRLTRIDPFVAGKDVFQPEIAPAEVLVVRQRPEVLGNGQFVGIDAHTETLLCFRGPDWFFSDEFAVFLKEAAIDSGRVVFVDP